MMILTHNHREERGAAALLLVVSGVIASLLLLMVWGLPLAGASSQRAKTQSAADAAALAGADAVLGGLTDSLKGLGSWNGSWDVLSGAGSTNGPTRAASYAERNGAELIAYQGPGALGGWRTYAKVRRVVDGETYVAEAWARINLPSCSTSPATPPPTTPPPPDDDEDETPPPPPNQTLRCSGLPGFTIIEGDLSLSHGWASFVDALLGPSRAKLTR